MAAVAVAALLVAVALVSSCEAQQVLAVRLIPGAVADLAVLLAVILAVYMVAVAVALEAVQAKAQSASSGVLAVLILRHLHDRSANLGSFN